jgi:hypothetical protein
MKFDEWFKLQFGNRPSSKSLFELEDEAESLALQAGRAKDLCHKVNHWEILRNACQYAWNLKDKDKLDIKG